VITWVLICRILVAMSFRDPQDKPTITLQRRLSVDTIVLGMYAASGPPANGEEAEDVTSVSDRRRGVRHPPVWA
jgi:hypothetical protein